MAHWVNSERFSASDENGDTYEILEYTEMQRTFASALFGTRKCIEIPTGRTMLRHKNSVVNDLGNDQFEIMRLQKVVTRK